MCLSTFFYSILQRKRKKKSPVRLGEKLVQLSVTEAPAAGANIHSTLWPSDETRAPYTYHRRAERKKNVWKRKIILAYISRTALGFPVIARDPGSISSAQPPCIRHVTTASLCLCLGFFFPAALYVNTSCCWLLVGGGGPSLRKLGLH
jgi:hypothetical protein